MTVFKFLILIDEIFGCYILNLIFVFVDLDDFVTWFFLFGLFITYFFHVGNFLRWNYFIQFTMLS